MTDFAWLTEYIFIAQSSGHQVSGIILPSLLFNELEKEACGTEGQQDSFTIYTSQGNIPIERQGSRQSWRNKRT